MSSTVPKGDLVTGPPAQVPGLNITLRIDGENLTSSVILVPLTPSHAADLFTNLGGPHNDHLYTYIPLDPIHTLEAMTTHISTILSNPIFFPYAILSSSPNHLSNTTPAPSSTSTTNPTAVGIICLMNITPLHRTLEIGHVFFSSTLQRTTEATEACYLLMKYSFENLSYLRVEWKTNSFNEGSRRAALRLGFLFEGVFRKHMIVKERRRDSVWFSVVDDEWFGRDVGEGKVGIKDALEGWLNKGNFDESGGQKTKLESFREGK